MKTTKIVPCYRVPLGEYLIKINKKLKIMSRNNKSF